MQNQKRTNKIGKVFRELKGIYKSQDGNVAVNQEGLFKNYRKKFIKLGMQLNNLNYCEYKLKNGLPYFGLKATSHISSNCELVKIPFDLLITCSTAYKSELQTIFDENHRYFLNNPQIECQKRILMFFLIYQCQIGVQSKWYHYIKNLPMDVKSFSFWPEQEQQLLNDRFLIEQATREKQTFYQEFEIFQEITTKYKNVFNQDWINIECFQRIYMILQTRIFGNTLPDLTLIPYCDLFNHECVNVYYELNYKDENGKAIKRAIEYRDKQFQEQQEYESDSSTDGSYDSLDLQEDDQFSQEDFREFLLKQEWDSYYVQIHETFEEKYNQAQETNENATISYIGMSDSYDYQLCPIGTQWKTIKDVYKIIEKFNDLVFTSKLEETIALLIAGQFNFVIDEYISRYMFNQIDSTELFSMINKIINEFISQRSQLESLQQSFKHQVLEYQTPQRQNFKVVEDQDTKIQYFVMSTSHKDKFEINSQVYFCYGRLSNRQLLLRYGFSLEYNKYDHVQLRLNYLTYANCRHTIYLAHKNQVKKTKLITLRQTRFPTELVQFCKALSFQYKIHNTTSIFVFDQYSQEHYAMLLAIEIITDHIKKYLNFDEVSFAQQLTDPNLNYHQYFSNIYKLEQQRICTQNINLLKMALMMIEDLKGCKQFDINSTKYDYSIPTYFIPPYKYMIAKYFKQCQFEL